MKLMIAVIQRQDEQQLTRALNQRQFRLTRISSEGGFLHEGNVTLFLSVDEGRVTEVLHLIRMHCQTRTKYIAPLPPVAESGEFYPANPIEVQVGGATVFVVDGEQIRL